MLTPEELSKLREILRREREKRDNYRKNYKIEDPETEKRISEIRQIIRSNDLLKKRTVDHIEVGTKFTFKVFGEERKEALLVEKEYDILKGTTPLLISKDSPLGQMLLGKSAHGILEKKLENGNSIAWGIVEEIKKDKKDYVHYIREKEFYDRMSKEEKRIRRKLLKTRSTSSHAAKEWERRELITESQLSLLQEEARRLLAKDKMNPVEKGRLKQTKKLLATAKTAPLPEDDRIGLGSQFSVTITTSEGSKTMRLECIERAVSEELSDEFMERISPMGMRVFGLKEKETFQYLSSSLGLISGTVFDIDNVQNEIKTTDASIYQTKKKSKDGLVEEQVRLLEEEHQRKTNLLIAKKESMEKAGYPLLQDQEMKKLKARLYEIRSLLTEENIIKNPNSDTIQLGSRVSLNLDFFGEIEEMNAVVVRKFVGHEASTNEFIALESPLGNAIVGKKETEEFSYLLKTGAVVTGKVVKIEKQGMIEKTPKVKGI